MGAQTRRRPRVLQVPGIDSNVLDPRKTWIDPNACGNQTRKLVDMFKKNFEQFKDAAPADVVAAGPCSDGCGPPVAAGVSCRPTMLETNIISNPGERT